MDCGSTWNLPAISNKRKLEKMNQSEIKRLHTSTRSITGATPAASCRVPLVCSFLVFGGCHGL
jgi:hypothetical protein